MYAIKYKANKGIVVVVVVVFVANILQLNQRFSRKKLCLNFSYQRTYFE